MLSTEEYNRTTAEAVAALLGPDWQCQPHDREKPGSYRRGFELVHPASSSLVWTWGRSDNEYAGVVTRGRLILHGGCTEKAPDGYYGPYPEISVADTRPPKQIAAEIQRRLLPKLNEIVFQILDRRATIAAADAMNAETVEALRAVLGPGAVQVLDPDRYPNASRPGRLVAYVDAPFRENLRVTMSGDLIEVESFSTDREQILALLRVGAQ